jgi:hypothetical protein
VSLPLAQGDAKGPTIGVDEIKEGMKGYGLTVFKGTRPERFDVEVVGVVRNFRPGQDLIMVKTPHPRLNITRNVRGMSGSPIYLDGRLAGAYAYSWSTFPIEPVAGVTPIAPMLVELRRPMPPGFWPLEGGQGVPGAPAASAAQQRHQTSLTSFDGVPGEYDLTKHAQQVAARVGLAPDGTRPVLAVATPMFLTGVGDRTARALRTLFEPLGFEPMQVGAGQGTAGTPEHYENGGVLGVQFIRGDLSAGGIGTATYVEGRKVAGFGHPMMEAGDTSFPACVGQIFWINASELHSSKIGECTRPLGTVIQDRQSAIVVDETKVAPTFPVRVEILGVVGAPKTVWNAEVAEDRFMTPSLTAAVLGAAVEGTVSERRDVTWQLRSKLVVAGHGNVELEDVGVSLGGTPDSGDWQGSRVVRTVGDILNNPWQRVRLERLEATFTVRFSRDLWRLRGVELLDPVVDAGERVRIRLKLLEVAGPEQSRTVEVRIPTELAGKEVDIEILPGHEVPQDLAPPESLPELLANAPRLSHAMKAVVLQIRVPGFGVAYRGKVTQRLPHFALDALRPATSDTGPDSYPSYVRTVVPLDRYLEGRDRVRVRVRASR